MFIVDYCFLTSLVIMLYFVQVRIIWVGGISFVLFVNLLFLYYITVLLTCRIQLIRVNNSSNLFYAEYICYDVVPHRINKGHQDKNKPRRGLFLLKITRVGDVGVVGGAGIGSVGVENDGGGFGVAVLLEIFNGGGVGVGV